jgi:hypothetical protein
LYCTLGIGFQGFEGGQDPGFHRGWVPLILGTLKNLAPSHGDSVSSSFCPVILLGPALERVRINNAGVASVNPDIKLGRELQDRKGELSEIERV